MKQTSKENLTEVGFDHSNDLWVTSPVLYTIKNQLTSMDASAAPSEPPLCPRLCLLSPCTTSVLMTFISLFRLRSSMLLPAVDTLRTLVKAVSVICNVLEEGCCWGGEEDGVGVTRVVDDTGVVANEEEVVESVSNFTDPLSSSSSRSPSWCSVTVGRLDSLILLLQLLDSLHRRNW